MNSKSNKLPVVFVNLGKVPRYLEKNIEYILTQFPNQPCYLITDQNKSSFPQKVGLEIIQLAEVMVSWPAKFEIKDKRKDFRNNFWFSSKARLLLLPEMMNMLKIERLLHIENDVWISPNFPFHLFETLSAPVAFPQVDEERGIASLLYVNGRFGIEILKDACEAWPEMTDMQILGQISHKYGSAVILPSTYGVSSLKMENWIFDGAKLGMYLFGSDSRNSRGVSKRFKRSPMGDLAPNQKILLKENQLLLKELNSEIRIASLHLHSKQARLFSLNWSIFLKIQLIKKSMRLNYRFDPAGAWKAMSELLIAILRRIRSTFIWFHRLIKKFKLM